MIKRTIDHIRKLNPEERKSLVQILGGGKKGDISFISQTLPTPVGLFRVLQSLSNEEYRIFVEACREASGATLGQLELALKLKREEIDAIADTLEKKLLAFVIKNRQHLHNKSDRLIAFEDIRRVFNPAHTARLRQMYQTFFETAISLPFHLR